MKNRVRTSLLRRMSMVLLGVVLVASSAVWPVGTRGASAQAGAQWIKVPSDTGSDLAGVAYGGNTWVAVGANGTIVTSTDGVNWTAAPVQKLNSNVYETRYFHDVAYHDGVWVAIGNEAMIYTSSDGGETWIQRDPIVNSSSFLAIEYGGGQFLSVGSAGEVLMSEDGVTWEVGQIPGGPYIQDIAYGEGKFVAADLNGVFHSSTNGAAWTASQPVGMTPYGIAYDGASFLASGEDGAIVVSEDGAVWTSQPSLANSDFVQDAVYNSGTYTLVGRGGFAYAQAFTSTDRINWTEEIVEEGSGYVNGVASNEDLSITVGLNGGIYVRGLSNNSSLESLTVTGVTLDPLFDPAKLAYTATVSSNTTKVEITPEAADLSASIMVNGENVESGGKAEVPLIVGMNPIDVIVTAQDKTQKTYTITVTRENSDLRLTNLTLSSGSLSEPFDPAKLIYTANVPNTLDTVEITPTLADPSNRLFVNNDEILSGESSMVELSKVENETYVTISISSLDGQSNEMYRLYIRKEPYSTYLNNVTISDVNLDPVFNKDNMGLYTATADSDVKNVTFTLTKEDPNAAVEVVEGTANQDGTFTAPLITGYNNFTVRVTAADGKSFREYYFSIYREIPNLQLSELTISEGELSPEFSSENRDYTATVSNDVYTLNVTPTSIDSDVVITINDEMTASGESVSVPLNVGNNYIYVTVGAPDHSNMPYSYVIVVNREGIVNKSANLSSLTLSEGMLEPEFMWDNYWYWNRVENVVNQIDVTPTSIDAEASITINGQAVESGSTEPVTLNEGYNQIEVQVTAADHLTVQTYFINVYREFNTQLSDLSISPGTLTPNFTSDETAYTASVGNEVESVEVTPTAKSKYAQIVVNGQPVESGDSLDVPLEVGLNTIVVWIVAGQPTLQSLADKSIDPPAGQMYTIEVSRAPAAVDVNLSDLTIDSGNLTPAFDPETKEYRASVTSDVYRIAVTPKSNNIFAQITVEGMEAASGEPTIVNLQPGENVIDIRVMAPEGVSNLYRITVTRASVPVDPGPVTPVPNPAPTTPVTPTPTPPANGLEVIVNGQPTTIVATGGTTQVEGETVFTATIDTARLATLLSGAGANQSVIIPVRTEADRVIATLTGEAAGLLSGSQATLRIETPLGNYTIPSSQLNLSAAANTLGLPANSADLLVNVVIEKSEPQVQTALSQAAANAGFTGVSAPIDFTITASSGGRTVEVNSFTEYVEREIPLPAGVDPNRVTTAVVIEPNGTVRHVPTEVTRTQTTDYARVNSLTNSSYALIFNPKQFPDVAGKWSQAAVNDMASRLVVNGIGADRYNPEGAVTRAEFAAILVRALGLPSGGQAGGFSDIAAADWYAGSAATANAYGLITGYPDGTFRPNDTITRQEAFAILDRAAQIVPLQAGEGSSELSSYRDRAKVADWAKSSAQAVLAAGLAEGSGGWLRPLETLSRAESAAVAQRLLQQANLIDQ